jgi:hypothetical protein
MHIFGVFSINYCDDSYRKPEIGVWEHVALVVNEGNLYFYVNGVLELTDSGSPSTLEGGFSLGNSVNQQEYYIGQVDELRICPSISNTDS